MDVLLHIIPPSFFTPFAEGEVLPVLFIALITASACARRACPESHSCAASKAFSPRPVRRFRLHDAACPIGAFGAIAFIVAKSGLKTIGNLGLLIFTLYVACGFFVFVVLWGLARFHGFSLFGCCGYFREELLIVLGTSSTEPVLPAVLYKLERLGCSKGSSASPCRSAIPSISTARPSI